MHISRVLWTLFLLISIASPAQTPRAATVSVTQLQVSAKARHRFEKAQAALNRGDAQEARKQVEAAIALSPTFPDALTMHALLELDSGSPDAALSEIDRVVSRSPTFGLAYLVKGSVLNRMGRYEDALRSLDREEMVEKPSWQCSFEKAKSWLGRQEFDHALREVDRAAALGGSGVMNSALHFVRGYALAGLQRYGRATGELEAYLAEEPAGPYSGLARATLDQLRARASLSQGAPQNPQ